MSKQNAGGIATAKILAEKARLRKQEYDLNPNKCLYCDSPILSSEKLKLRETKIKKFCNHSCSAKYSNVHRVRISKIPYGKCKKCNIDILKKKGLCEACSLEHKLRLSKKTKGELFNSSKNWQSARSTIQKNARKIFAESSLEKQCKVCGYDRHYEVCHIKDVSSFSDESLVSEINSIDNLVALCPTHHWEFDNDYISF